MAASRHNGAGTLAAMIKRSVRILAIVTGLAIVGPPSLAQDSMQVYDVELLIFKVNKSSATPEDWALEEARAKSSLPDTHDSEEAATTDVPAVPAVANDSSIQPLEASRYRMSAIEASLRRSANYQPLAYAAWSQPGFPLDSPRPVAIENFVDASTGLSGTVTVTRGTYLHLVVDLTLKSATDERRFVLREHRRMRKSGEKHYLDHPEFGVIALITPRG